MYIMVTQLTRMMTLEKWCDLKFALSAQHYSPAAKRMAITLLFAAHVMAPRLVPVSALPSTKYADLTFTADQSHTCHRSIELLDELFMAAKHSSAFNMQSSVLMQESYDERLTAAMLISLVAVSSHCTGWCPNPQ